MRQLLIYRLLNMCVISFLLLLLMHGNESPYVYTTRDAKKVAVNANPNPKL